MSYQLSYLEFLANIPRLSLRLSSLDKTEGLYDVTSQDYRWSLFWIASLGAALSVVLLVVFFISVCARLCCCRRSRVLPKYWLHRFLAILTIMCAGAAGYFLFKAYTTSKNLLDHTTDTANTFDGHVETLQDSDTYYSDNFVSLINQLEQYGRSDLAQNVSQAMNLCTAQADRFSNLIFPSFAFGSATQPASSALLGLLIITCAFMAVALLAGLTLFFGMRTLRHCTVNIQMFFCLVCSFVALLVSSVMLAALMPGVDMCPNPSAYAQTFGFDNLNFYVTCDPDAFFNPYRVPFKESVGDLQSAVVTLSTVRVEMTETGLSPMIVTPLIDSVQAALSFVDSMSVDVGKCTTVNTQLVSLFSSACEDLSSLLYNAMWLCVALGVLLYIDAILFLFWDHGDDFVLTDDPERQPLIPPMASPINAPSDQCEICFERPKSIVFNPCGHVSCEQCSHQIHVCPYCRAPIGTRLQFFL